MSVPDSKINDSTDQLPPTLGHVLNLADRFHVDAVGNGKLRNPYRAEEVTPMARGRLFECSAFVGTEQAALEVNSCLLPKDYADALTTGTSGETVHLRHSHCPSGMYGTP